MQLVCLGDSITDCNRLFEDFPLGNGYVQILSREFQKTHRTVSIKNYGVDGFTLSRVLENVLHGQIDLHRTPVITLLIGINDIGLMLNTDRTAAQKEQMMNDFFIRYEYLLKLLIEKARKVIVMEPFIFPRPEKYKLWIPYVQTMGQGIQQIAENFHINCLSLHNYLNDAASREGFSSVTIDGIHLTKHGHELLATKLYPLISA